VHPCIPEFMPILAQNLNPEYIRSDQHLFSTGRSRGSVVDPDWIQIQAVFRILIRDPVPFLPLDPGSGIDFFRIRIPKPYFGELNDNFLHEKFYNSLKIGPNFFLQQFKHKKIFSFVKFVATKQGMTNNFFSPLSFVAVFGSGMGKNQDPGSG
jgi:hypothetical protein